MKTLPLRICVICAICGSFLPACSSWTPETKAKASATGSFLAQKAAAIALRTVVSAAVGQADASTKGNYLDSLATGFRSEVSIDSSDIAQLVQIWTPGDKPHWAELATSITQLFESTRDLPEAERIEAIATGLNLAAAKARSGG